MINILSCDEIIKITMSEDGSDGYDHMKMKGKKKTYKNRASRKEGRRPSKAFLSCSESSVADGTCAGTVSVDIVS